MRTRIESLLDRIPEREGEQPQRSLLVERNAGKRVDRVFDVAERLSPLDQI